MAETNQTAEKKPEPIANMSDPALAEQDPARWFSLLKSAACRKELTVRDDQFPFSLLLDAVKKTVGSKGRFRLVDSGTLDMPHLEWLLDAGADFYTSDENSRNTSEIEALSLICRRNRARLACFIYSADPEEKQEAAEPEEEPQAPVLDTQRLALAGAYLYISNREKEWDLAELVRLAEDCRRSGARLIYYHQGEFPRDGFGLAEAGAWIHVTQAVLTEEGRVEIADAAAAAHKKGGGLIIHIQEKPDFLLLEEIFNAGAYVRFEFAQIHYRSPLKPIEQAANKRQPAPCAFYLQKDFLP